MKKIILSVAALLVCTATAFGQNTYELSGSAHTRFEWGVKGGLNLSTITDTPSDVKMKPGIYVGVFAEFLLVEDYLTVQPEVVYSRQGAKWNNVNVVAQNDEIRSADVFARLNYINIPVIFKLYLIDGLSLDLGPQIGFLLDAKDRYKVDGGTNFTEDGEGQKNFDVSFDMGLSYRFIPQMDVTARYNLGLTKVYDVDGSKSKNGVIQLGVGYRF